MGCASLSVTVFRPFKRPTGNHQERGTPPPASVQEPSPPPTCPLGRQTVAAVPASSYRLASGLLPTSIHPFIGRFCSPTRRAFRSAGGLSQGLITPEEA